MTLATMPALQGAQSSEQFTGIKRLDQEIIGATVEAADFGVDAVTGSEDQYRAVDALLAPKLQE